MDLTPFIDDMISGAVGLIGVTIAYFQWRRGQRDAVRSQAAASALAEREAEWDRLRESNDDLAKALSRAREERDGYLSALESYQGAELAWRLAQYAHARWDVSMMAHLHELGVRVDPPPPLPESVSP